MNIIHKVTLQTLKKNKRRTVITILGTAVAVAMVTALSVLSASFMGLYRAEAVLAYGNYHMMFSGIDARAMPVLEEYENAENINYSCNKGYALLPGTVNATRRQLMVVAYNPNGLADLKLNLLAGRLPEAPGEILLSENFMYTQGDNFALGQTLTLDSGHYTYEFSDETGVLHTQVVRGGSFVEEVFNWQSEGAREYTIVGYAPLRHLEQGYQNTFTALTVFDPAQTSLGNTLAMDAWVRVKNANSAVYPQGEALGAQLAGLYGGYDEEPSFNTDLLAADGVLRNNTRQMVIYPFVGMLLFIVLAGSVSLIYNAFSISLAERVRALGMLAGVGATRRQKRQSVLFEALVVGAFAVPAGVLGGIAGIGVTLWLLGEAIGRAFAFSTPMRMVVSLPAVLFTVLFSAFMLLLSALFPAVRAAKISPVSAMRSGGITRVARVRPARLTRRLLGFEGELGLKNSKRNRKRYLAILSSLVISVVLFLSVAGGMKMVRQSGRLVITEMNHSVQTQLYPTDPSLTFAQLQQEVASLRALPDAGVMDAFYPLLLQARLPADKISERAAKALPPPSEANEYEFSAEVYGLEEETLLRYCEAIGVDASLLAGENAAILLSTLPTRTEEGGWAQMQATTLQPEDTVQTTYNLYEGQDTGAGSYNVPWRIAAVTGTPPGVFREAAGPVNTFVLVTPLHNLEALARQVYNDEGHSIRFIEIYSHTQNPAGLYEALEALPSNEQYSQSNYNVEENTAQRRTILFIIEVFTYGFVALITLVCAANIFNTVSTDIALRTREFALLRSAGLSRKGFNRMLDCETFFYGVKALAIGLPASILVSYALYRVLMRGFEFGAFSPPVSAYLIAVLGVFAIVGASMLYARRKVGGLNIAETLKNENW